MYKTDLIHAYVIKIKKKYLEFKVIHYIYKFKLNHVIFVTDFDTYVILHGHK